MIKNAISVQTCYGRLKIDPNQITHCVANSNYTWLFLENKSKYLIPRTLTFCETAIASISFIRIHQSYLINKNFIKKIEGKSIELTVGSTLSISRRMFKMVNESLVN